MGFFSMYPSGKRLTPTELKKKLLPGIYAQKFSPSDRQDVNNILQGHMNEKGHMQGIDAKEAEEIIDYMRKNKRAHHLSEEQIDILDKKMKDLI